MMSSSGYGASVGVVLPNSTALSRRLGHHQYERVAPISTAGMFDWKLSNCRYNTPILPGQHNAFPTRTPSASSDKLRQMYLNTDTISGKLVHSSARERGRQKRLHLLQRTLEQQALQLEERNRQLNVTPTSSDREEMSEVESQDVIVTPPPFRTSRGLTIIKESRRLSNPQTPVPASDDPNTAASDKVHAEMSIYLPRADAVDNLDIPQNTSRSESSSKPRRKVGLSRTAQPHIKFSHPKRLDLRPENTKVDDLKSFQDRRVRSASRTSQLNRPITANW